MMPNATPLNHQKVRTRIDDRAPNMMAFVFVENRLEEKMKWSSTCENMRTAKYSVGN